MREQVKRCETAGSGDRNHGWFEEEEVEEADACEVGAEESGNQEVPEEVDETDDEGVVRCEGRPEEEDDSAKTTASSAASGSTSAAKGVCREGAGLRRGHGDLVHRCWQR